MIYESVWTPTHVVVERSRSGRDSPAGARLYPLIYRARDSIHCTPCRWSCASRQHPPSGLLRVARARAAVCGL